MSTSTLPAPNAVAARYETPPPLRMPITMTLAEFAVMLDNEHFELIDGVPVEKRMGSLAAWIGSEINSVLAAHVRQHKLGWVFNAEGGFACFGPTRQLLRKPDVSFLSLARWPNPLPDEGDLTVAPDLAVEVVSPNETAYKLEQKVADYLNAGVRLIWLIYPEQRWVRVVRANRKGDTLTATETLTGEDVLPGFSVSVAELFPVAPSPVVGAIS